MRERATLAALPTAVLEFGDGTGGGQIQADGTFMFLGYHDTQYTVTVITPDYLGQSVVIHVPGRSVYQNDVLLVLDGRRVTLVPEQGWNVVSLSIEPLEPDPSRLLVDPDTRLPVYAGQSRRRGRKLRIGAWVWPGG